MISAYFAVATLGNDKLYVFPNGMWGESQVRAQMWATEEDAETFVVNNGLVGLVTIHREVLVGLFAA